MPSFIVTLITDFGLKDHYVGTMKGVMLTTSPELRLVDITHNVPPFSIREGAYALLQAAPNFPSETVHLVVVDPGVGTSRRAILVEANRQLFVAPDNGVLSLVLQNCSHYRVRELTNRALWLFSPSSTFHGRDIFAPVAAALASGKAHPEDVGPVLDEVAFLPDLEPLSVGEQSYKGIVLSVDRFGNVITNFSIERHLVSLRAGVRLLAGSTVVDAFQKTFANARPGEIFVFPGSSGFLEIGMNQGSAAHTLGLAPGQSIQLNTPV